MSLKKVMIEKLKNYIFAEKFVIWGFSGPRKPLKVVSELYEVTEKSYGRKFFLKKIEYF